MPGLSRHAAMGPVKRMVGLTLKPSGAKDVRLGRAVKSEFELHRRQTLLQTGQLTSATDASYSELLGSHFYMPFGQVPS